MHASVRFAVLASLAATAALAPRPACACTAFAAPSPAGMLFAKGFDWVTGEGWIVANERGRVRTLLVPGGGDFDRWTARYASLSLTTVGPGFPVSGMNEKGLALEALVDLSAASTATAEPGRLIGLELVQYALDRFATVDELADFAAKARVSQRAVALHFLACDASGRCAAVEPRRDGTRVTRALQAKALANRPYAEDLASLHPSALSRWLGLGRPSPGSSAARFSVVARAIAGGPLQSEAQALSLLEKVVMPGRTQWQLVWNLERRTLLLRQREAGLGTMALRLDERVGPCTGAPRAFPIGRRAPAKPARWTAEDAPLAAAAVLRQVGRAGPAERRLAEAVARATLSSTCRTGE